MTIDRTVLWKDPLDNYVPGDIAFGTPLASYLTLVNSGTIKEMANADIIRTDTTQLVGQVDLLETQIGTIDHGPSHVYFDTDVTMSYNIYLGPEHLMYIQDDLVLNGSTYFIHMSRSDEPLFFIDSGKTVTLQNIVLKDFSREVISFGDATSKLVFGQGTTVELARDLSLSRMWTFTGDCTIKGFGNTVTLGSGAVLDTYNSSTLRLHDLALSGLGSQKLRCRTNDGSIVFRNSEVALSSNYNFSYGSMLFEKDVKVTGTTTFAYSSVMASTIDSESKLFFDVGTTFSYDSPNTNRDLLVMTDTSAKLHLNGCTLYSTPTGIRFTGGRLFLENFITLSADGQVASEGILFDSDLIVDSLGSAYVEVYGYVDAQ